MSQLVHHPQALDRHLFHLRSSSRPESDSNSRHKGLIRLLTISGLVSFAKQ